MITQQYLVVISFAALLTLVASGCSEEEKYIPSVSIEGPSSITDAQETLPLKVITTNFSPTHYEWTIEDDEGRISKRDKTQSSIFNHYVHDVRKDTHLTFTVTTTSTDNKLYTTQHNVLVTDRNTPPKIESIEFPDTVYEHDTFSIKVTASDDQERAVALKYKLSEDHTSGTRTELDPKPYLPPQDYHESSYTVRSLREPAIAYFDIEVIDSEQKSDTTRIAINVIPTTDRLGDYIRSLDDATTRCLLNNSQYSIATPIDQVTHFSCPANLVDRPFGLMLRSLAIFDNLQSIVLESSKYQNWDFSEFSNLKVLKIAARQANVSGLLNKEKLEHVNIHANKITDLDLSASPHLKHIDLYPRDEVGSLNDIQLHPEASPVYISIGNLFLSTFDIADTSKLEHFHLSERHYWSFENFGDTLDLSQAELLKTVYVYSEYLNTIDISSSSKLEEITIIDDWYPNTELQLPQLEKVKNLTLKRVTVQSLDFLNTQPLEHLYLSDITSNSPLEDFESPTAKTIEIYRAPIHSVDVREASDLTELTLTGGDIAHLTLPEESSLRKLTLSTPKSEEFSLSGHDSLEDLSLHLGLSKFHINHSPNIKKLSLSYNEFTELDFSNTPNIEELSVSSNRLTRLDTSGLHALTTLYALNNELDTAN